MKIDLGKPRLCIYNIVKQIFTSSGPETIGDITETYTIQSNSICFECRLNIIWLFRKAYGYPKISFI